MVSVGVLAYVLVVLVPIVIAYIPPLVPPTPTFCVVEPPIPPVPPLAYKTVPNELVPPIPPLLFPDAGPAVPPAPTITV